MSLHADLLSVNKFPQYVAKFKSFGSVPGKRQQKLLKRRRTVGELAHANGHE